MYQLLEKKSSQSGQFFTAVFLNLFSYVTHCLVSIGYAFVDVGKHTLIWSSDFIHVCNSVRMLLLNASNVFPRCSY